MSLDSAPSKTDDGWTGRRIDFASFSATLSERRAALDAPDLPRNGGKRRTASKKALLAAIDKAGGTW